MSIIAIDPGTAHTGIVYMDSRRVISAKTIAYRRTVRDDQSALMERAANIARQIDEWAADKPHDAMVIEGFVGYPGRQGGYTFQTPYLCGYLHAALSDENIVIQTSRQVLNPRSRGNTAEYKALMERGMSPLPGCELCTNDHLRSAACHGIYYYSRKRLEES